jgi:hypothetical protein
MSTLTTRLGLKKPQDSDPFLTSDFDTTYDLIDSYPGVWVCTQSTRPVWGSAQAGQLIFCTDTRTPYEWTGSAWKDPLVVPAAWELASNINTFVMPPGSGFPGTTSYTVGTMASTRAATVTCFVVLNFQPPPGYVVMDLTLGVTVGSQVLIVQGGRWSQAGSHYTGTLANSPTGAPTSVVGWGLVNVAAGSNTVSVQVTLANSNTFDNNPYLIKYFDAAVYITSINNSTP